MKHQIISIPPKLLKTRLDKFLTSQINSVTREQIQDLIKNGFVKVDNKVVKKNSYNLLGKKEINVMLPFREKVTLMPQPEIPVEIIYEDNSMVVINKPAGLVVHPAPGNWDGTLINALLGKQIKKENFTEDSLRIGLVHRLDKYTSGVIVIAKNNLAKANLARQFKNRTAKKAYLSLLHGILQPKQGTIEAPIGRNPYNRKKMAVISEQKGGKIASTDYKVLEYRNNKYTLVEASPKTGRTHQIRVHFASIGHPVVGDKTYCKLTNDLGLEYQALHAWKLEIKDVNGLKRNFIANPPKNIFGNIN